MKKAIILMLAVLSVGTIKAMDHDIDAQTWCKNVVMGWNLGNSLEAEGSETSWGNPKTTKDMIKAVKAQGFNAIRIPVRWGQHCNMTTMEIDATWLARVKEVVDWCLEEDLMVIVNTHHDIWLEHYPTYAKKEEVNNKLKKLWTNIATYFKDYDGRLAFAGTNEVNPNDDWGATPSAENFEVQNSFNQTFIDAVRATGGNNAKRNLIVQTMRCDPYLGMSKLKIPNDPTENRLSVEFHYYNPNSYCFGDEGGYYYWGKAFADKGEICPDGNESSMKAFFSQLRKEWWDNGLGVVIGEYGCAHHYTEADRATQEENQKYYMKCLVGEARHMGFAAFVWDNNGFGNGSEKFGIFNRHNNMSVDAPFFLNGIKEGSKEEYVEDIGGEEGDPDVGVGGTVIWEGEEALDWGTGLKVRIEAAQFAPYKESVTLVIYYRQDASASYEDIQLNYLNDWEQFECKVDGVTIDGNFSPRSFYGTMGATHITPFTIEGSVLTRLKKDGAVIQGYGATLTKVVLIDKPSKAMDHDIDAQTWCKNVVMGWNLGNSLEAEGSETSWGNPKTTKDMIKAVKAQGFNAIRIPVRWGQHCNMTTMEIDATWLARVKEVVDWCLEEDLMVIVNTHHDLWLEHYPTKAKKAELNDKLKKLWTNIATYFKDYDGRLAFAGTNEVNPNGDWGATPSAENFEVQNSFNQTFIDAVRATGGNNAKRNLIVQTMRCNPYMGLSDLIIPNDPTENRLSVEFHYYDPYSYCNGGEGSYYYWGKAFADKGEICPDGNESSMKAFFSQLRKEWWDNGLGVVIGEYGCAHHYTEADRATQEENQKYYMKCLVGEARHMGFAAFVWDNNGFGNGSEKFGIFNRWNNMSVDAPFFLNGIKEGSKEEYVEDIGGEEGDPDVGVGGTVIWEGEEALNWGTGLQVKIEAEKFAPYAESVTLVIYYRQDASASYEDIQLNYLNDWKQFECKVDGVTIDGNFSPRSFYGTTGATHITPFTIEGSVLTRLKKDGAVIQGFGATLTKVVLIDKPSTAINTTIADETAEKAIYDLSGRKVKSPTKKGLYIVGGKMILKD